MRLIAILFIFLSVSVFADDTPFAIGGGLYWNQTDTSRSLGSGVKEEDSIGFNLGVRGLFKMTEQLSFRTGAYLQEKSAKYGIDVAGVKGAISARVLSQLRVI